MKYFIHTPFWLPLIYPKFIWRGDTTTKKIYLTFDDGPHPSITPFVLDCLKKYNIKAQFFCVGNNVAKYPQVYQQIINEGHITGNHTYQHKNGWKTDNEMYFDEVQKTEVTMNSFLPSPLSFSVGEGNRMRSIEKKKEESGTKFFRPPYGKLKKAQAKKILHHYKIVMWTRLTADFDKSITKEKCLAFATSKPLKNGEIILFHDSEKAFER
ncbi:MAG: hypothetical protein RI955_938, partial [Bacteroidota bacterium]